MCFSVRMASVVRTFCFIVLEKGVHMEENNLPKAIAMLYDMESSVYFMTRAIKELEPKIASLGHPRNIKEPILAVAQTPYRDEEEESEKTQLIGAVIGFAIGFIYGLLFDYGEATFWLTRIIGGIIVGIVFGLIGFGVSWLIYWLIRILIIPFIDLKKRRKSQKKYDAYYDEECKEYSKKVEQDRQRALKELDLKQKLIAERNHLIDRRKEASEKLKEFYDTVNIDSGFRNIVAISCMDNLVRLNISTKLEGTDGLYYLVMQQLDKLKLWEMLNGISGKLDSIINQLDCISGRLDFLDKQIVALNNSCDRLIHQTVTNTALLQNIESNTVLSLYHQERMAKEEAYQSTLMTWTFLKNW